MTHADFSSFLIETRSLPAFARCCPRGFAFYVAHPTHSIPTSFPAKNVIDYLSVLSYYSEP
ncbi:MAG: hypothetical protein DMG97_31805 [Acidobacteria bacterium]|nr:MAG: hypothetical protein DMG97_31805 [Acidobacteriota bacterium]